MIERTIIPGPCAANTERQMFMSGEMIATVASALLGEVLRKNITLGLRGPGTKETTSPRDDGWTGPHEDGFIWLFKTSKHFDLLPATEIVSVDEAKIVALLCKAMNIDKLFIWFGSRLSKGKVIRDATEILMGVPNLKLKVGVKNPSDGSIKSWRGRFDWLKDLRLDPMQQLFAIDRGRTPLEGELNPDNLRNFSIHDTTWQIINEIGCKGLKDPSHSGGTPKNVLNQLETCPRWFSGHIFEACPTETLTDEIQRLDHPNFIKAMEIIAQSLQYD
jgi:hypothetical protein